MELRHFRAFVAVAEERNFTRAGQRLHIGQSAVSTTLQALERELGVILIDRATSPVALTEAGTVLLIEARRTLASADAAVAAVDALGGGLRGTVRMGIMPSRRVRRGGFAEIVKVFTAAYPDVRLEVRVSGPPLIAAGHVADGVLDLAFLSLTGVDVPGVHLDPIRSDPIVLVCHRAHRLAQDGPVQLTDLGDEVFADLPAHFGGRMAIDPALERADVERNVRYEVNDHTAVVDFVAQDLAIALLPASFVTPHLDVRTVPVSDAPDFVTSLALPTNRAQGVATRAMVEIVRELSVDGLRV